MGLFSKLFNKDNEIEHDDEDEITAVISAVLSSMDNEEEVVAAITAAITCMLGTSDFTVKNIKRTSELDSIWSLAGRMKLMR